MGNYALESRIKKSNKRCISKQKDADSIGAKNIWKMFVAVKKRGNEKKLMQQKALIKSPKRVIQ